MADLAVDNPRDVASASSPRGWPEGSTDGRVAIGFGNGPYNSWGFRWTRRGGALKLVGQDWEARSANAASANGDVVVGRATRWWGGPEIAFRWIKNPADVNGDGFLNGDDFDQFSEAFETGDPSGDFNRDGFVNGDDYDGFAEAFEAGC
ncbi:MAG: EF-hand domain-containing protein [Phycisphaerales bacterium]|nr:EF-hand domain-containing protein [Phycisphaerales bacterium]